MEGNGGAFHGSGVSFHGDVETSMEVVEAPRDNFHGNFYGSTESFSVSTGSFYGSTGSFYVWKY